MFNRKKKSLKEQQALESFRADLDNILTALGEAYTSAVNEKDAGKRFLGLKNLKSRIETAEEKQDATIKTVKENVEDKKFSRGLYISAGMIGALMSPVLALGADSAFITFIRETPFLTELYLISMFGSGAVGINAIRASDKSAKKVATKYKIAMADFEDAVNDLKENIDQKLTEECDQNYCAIVKSESYNEVIKQYPSLAAEFATKAQKSPHLEKPAFKPRKGGLNP